MSNRSYIPLYYLTIEGRYAADREGLNSTNPLDGSKVSLSQLKDLRRDRNLSISEIHEAGKVLLELIAQYGWGKDCERMFFSFFMEIDCHAYRNETGPHAVGPKALTLYADRVRKRWHDDLVSNSGKATYSIARIDITELSNCHLQAQNEAFDLRVFVSANFVHPFEITLSFAYLLTPFHLWGPFFSTTNLRFRYSSFRVVSNVV